MYSTKHGSESSLNSVKTSSRGSASLSAIHPVDVDDVLDSVENQNNSQDINKLFSVVNKAKASIFVETGCERRIHIVHYAQKESDLYANNTVSGPDHENYESKVLLIFIHGVGGSASMWDPQITHFLSFGYEILAIDLLGHGKSSKPRVYDAYEFKELASDTLIVFDRFCKRRNVLIGHSYGSSFCTYLSKERGSKICKTVLISGGGPTMLMPDQCSAFCLPLPMFVCIHPSLVKIFRRMAFHVNTSEIVRRKISTFEVPSFVLKAIMQGQNWFDSTEEYHANLNLPVLLIYGEGDQFVTLEEEKWMQETIYGSDLQVIEEAGHMVILESPSKVNELIHSFLNRDPSTWSTYSVERQSAPTPVERTASCMSRASVRSLRSKVML